MLIMGSVVNLLTLLGVIETVLPSAVQSASVELQSATSFGKSTTGECSFNGTQTLELRFTPITSSFEGKLITVNLDGVSGIQLYVDRQELCASILNNGKPSNITLIKLEKGSFDLARSEQKPSLYSLTITSDQITLSKGDKQIGSFNVGTNWIHGNIKYDIEFGHFPDSGFVSDVIATQTSVIGCIKDILIVRGGNTENVQLLETPRNEIGDSCGVKCSALKCQGSDFNVEKTTAPCLNHALKETCQCFNSSGEGKECDTASKVVTLSGHKDSYYEYHVVEFKGEPDESEPAMMQGIKWTSEHPLQFGLRFMTNADPKNDYLLMAIQFDLFNITIKLSGNNIVYVYNNGATFETSAQDGGSFLDNRWHTLRVELFYVTNQIIVTADSILPTLHENKDILLNNATFKLIKLGGSETLLNGIKSFEGELKDFYIDYNSILAVTPDTLTLYHDKQETPLLKEQLFAEVGQEEPPSTLAELDNLAQINSSSTSQTITIPSSKPGSTQPSFCETIKCMHDGICDDHNQQSPCTCVQDGYTGRYCQFVKYPKSCQAYYDMGVKESGIYHIDADGEGPLTAILVRCSFDKVSGRGWTSVDNNMGCGEETEPCHDVRSNIIKDDLTYFIDYRYATHDHLVAIVQDSGECQQSFQYKCYSAPLGLPSQTFFTSLKRSNPPFGTFKELEISEDCENGASTTISGTLRDKNAGLVSATFLREKSDSKASINLGPLQCSASEATAVTVTDPAVDLNLDAWKGGLFSYRFKTGQRSFKLMEQTSQTYSLSVIVEDRVVTIYISESNSLTPVESILLPSTLSDNEWHQFSISYNRNQFHIVLNDHFKVVDEPSTFGSLQGDAADLTIGGQNENTPNSGFVGCLVDIVLNNNHLVISNLWKDIDGIKSGCQSQCEQSTDKCLNNATCTDNYQQGTYACTCTNKWRFSGERCEIDTNSGKKISLYSQKSHIQIQYKDEAVPFDYPIKTQFAFKTDKEEGLLFYGYDQFYNFIQVTLVGRRSIELRRSVTVPKSDSLASVMSCVVTVTDTAYNKGEWHQIGLDISTLNTILFVDDNSCIIETGELGWSDWFISSWSNSNLISVHPPGIPSESFPPRGGSLTRYTYFYFGGIASTQLGGATFSFEDTSSKVHLEGCLVGIMLNGKDILSSDDLFTASDIANGCNYGSCVPECDRQGTCLTDDWSSVTEGSCDCSFTSYAGSTCDTDEGFSLHGTNVGVVGPVKQAQIPGSNHRQAIQFAFSTFSSSELPQQLIDVEFSDDVLFGKVHVAIWLTTTGAIKTNIYSETNKFRQVSYISEIAGGNVDDKERHFYRLEIRPNQLFPRLNFESTTGQNWIEIDLDNTATYFKLPDQLILNLEDIDTLIVGGRRGKVDGQFWHSFNYTGCISNIEIFGGTSRPGRYSHFSAARAFVDLDLKFYTEDRSVDKNMKLGKCAQFRKHEGPHKAGVDQTFDDDWFPELMTKKYDRPNVGPHGNGKKDSKSGVAIGIGIVLAIVILAVIAFLVYRYCYKTESYRTDVEADKYAPINQSDPAKENGTKEDHELKPLNRPLSDEPPRSPFYQRPPSETETDEFHDPTIDPEQSNEPGFRDLQTEIARTPPAYKNPKKARLSELFPDI